MVLVPVEVVVLVAAVALGLEPKYFFLLWIVLFLALMVPVSALTTVFNTALYLYATEGVAAGPFNKGELERAYEPKRRRVRGWLFGRRR